MVVLDRLDFLLRMRLRGKPAILGLVFLGILALSLILFLLIDNQSAARILFFPSHSGRRMVAEERLLPRHWSRERDVTELVEGVLLGPTGHDALRIFPRGASVLSALIHGHTLYLDLSPRVLGEDPEVPLHGEEALSALSRSIRFNFPRLREIVISIDGQIPRFTGKKNI
ncbi:MAG: GerMN domain-containing protein [Spirochaetia bacterium]